MPGGSGTLTAPICPGILQWRLGVGPRQLIDMKGIGVNLISSWGSDPETRSAGKEITVQEIHWSKWIFAAATGIAVTVVKTAR